MTKLKKFMIGGACATAMLGTAGTANAGLLTLGVPVLSIGLNFKGWLTMLDPTGEVNRNISYIDEPTFHGWRTPINGKMVLQMGAGGLTGAATFDSFLFNTVVASGRDVTFNSPNALLNLVPTNTLMLGNMLFDYGKLITDIPVSLVLDIGNLTTALSNTAKGQLLRGILTAGSDDTLVDDGNGGRMAIAIGPVLVSTTTLDTTDVDSNGDGVPGPVMQKMNPSGTVPLIEDTVSNISNGNVGIAGSPIKATLFKGFSPAFDITEATVTCVSAVLSCNAAGLKLPPVLTLSAKPLEPLLVLLPN